MKTEKKKKKEEKRKNKYGVSPKDQQTFDGKLDKVNIVLNWICVIFLSYGISGLFNRLIGYAFIMYSNYKQRNSLPLPDISSSRFWLKATPFVNFVIAFVLVSAIYSGLKRVRKGESFFKKNPKKQ